MNQFIVCLILIGMLSLLIGIPVVCICSKCKSEDDSTKYLLK